MSRRRPVPFRIRIALAAFAGLAVAWLLPRGGTPPAPGPGATPSDRPGVTAVQIPLGEIPEGVSYRLLDGVRVFLVRDGATVTAFHGRSTARGDGPVYWCLRNRLFETGGPGPFYGRNGVVARYSAPRDLERVRVLVAANIVSVFPHDISPGPLAPPTPSPPPSIPGPPIPCAASERLG